MMRSLFSGVSGLKTHQTRMDVIGNNIANVNTTSYKTSSMVFQSLISQTTQGATGPNAETGRAGVNARQIGLGVRGGAINTNITGQGAAQSTGFATDIMINGENFFVVNDGSQNFMTRDGSFYVDAVGNLAMTSTGYNVMGWQVDPDTNDIKVDTVSQLKIMSPENLTYEPEYTQNAYVNGIIDKNNKDITSNTGRIINLNFYDNLGYSYTAKMAIKGSASPKDNVFSVELVKILDSTGKEQDISAVKLGGQGRIQTVSKKVSANPAYEFDGSNVYDPDDLDTTQNPPKGKKYPAGTSTIADVFAAGKIVQGKEKDAAVIAKAFGYDGRAEDFAQLQVNIEYAIDPTTGQKYTAVAGGVAETTATPPAKYLYELLVDDPTMIKIGQAVNADPTVANNGQPGKQLVGIDGWTYDTADKANLSVMANQRIFDGMLLTYDAPSGKIRDVDGDRETYSATLELEGFGASDDTGTRHQFHDIKIDFSASTMYNNKGVCTVGAVRGDADGNGAGRQVGNMTGFTIQEDGKIYAAYDSGVTRLLGQIATASFPNASGLEKKGDNLYSPTMNSGEFDGVGVDVTQGGGKLTSGSLEMSNVDLSEEFTAMITTQRGFQANSRIITVSDTLLEELTNLKR